MGRGKSVGNEEDIWGGRKRMGEIEMEAGKEGRRKEESMEGRDVS